MRLQLKQVRALIQSQREIIQLIQHLIAIIVERVSVEDDTELLNEVDTEQLRERTKEILQQLADLELEIVDFPPI